MSALLKLFGLNPTGLMIDLIWLGIILSALGGVGIAWHVHNVHEQEIGLQKQQAADKKVADAAIVHNKEVEDLVAKRLAAALAVYQAAQPIAPPAPLPGIVCRHTVAPVGSVLPSGQGSVAGSHGTGASVPVGAAQVDAGFDPAPAVSATGTAADEEIAHLLAKIQLLQDTIAAYQAGGLVAK